MTPSLFQEMGGTAMCRKLSTVFYGRVQHDPVLKPLFPGKTMHCAIEEFAAFLVQFLGGPSEDSQRRWWLSLRESHRRFRLDVTQRAAWLRLMQEALDEVEIAEPARGALGAFFEQSSAYVINSEPKSHEMTPELEGRWHTQKVLDDTVAAIREGDTERAIRLAETCSRATLPGLLAMMIGAGDLAWLRYAHERISADPALVGERYAGRTLLHSAAAAGSLSSVRILLRLGADPNVQDGGKHTPLYSVANGCAGAESADVIHALVRAGARVDARDGVMKCTPLHMAARRGNVAAAKALLECGADIAAKDKRGDTPLQRAINCKKPQVAALLAPGK